MEPDITGFEKEMHDTLIRELPSKELPPKAAWEIVLKKMEVLANRLAPKYHLKPHHVRTYIEGYKKRVLFTSDPHYQEKADAWNNAPRN